jgi:phosphatidylglycerophosphate synthase
MPDDHSPSKRTPEIEEVTNRYVIHPVSRACVRFFARWGVAPNAVSLTGMGLGAAAALAYYHYPHGPMALLGFALMLGWHVMDGADGQLARLTGHTSALGKVLDGVCDYVTFVLVYLALAAASGLGAWAWAAAVLAGLSHAAQASAYEFQRQAYDCWARDKGTRPLSGPAATASDGRTRGVARLFDRLHRGYLRLQRRVAVVDEPLHDELAAALRHAGDADAERRLREGYCAIQAGGVRRWALLSSNYRTLAIFLACLAGAPVLFFVFEIVFLNAAFLLLARMQRKHDRALRTWLAEQRASHFQTTKNEPVCL